MNPKREDSSPDNEHSGFFIFGMRVFGQREGKYLVDIQIGAENVPKELIIVKMKAQLRQFEKEYFMDFDNVSQGTG